LASVRNETETTGTGDVQAQFAAGQACHSGHGRPRDYRSAEEWYSKAAGQGHAGAMFALGQLYLQAFRDHQRAHQWLQRSAERHHPEALYWLGHLYLEEASCSNDRIVAYEWLALAAALGCGGAEPDLNRLERLMSAEEILQAQEQANQRWKTAVD
jgi:TPR repeat protein